ncbi:DUF2255 family protein [Chloroflexi bacterium CFX2]|nr:DUF2255 family protein [Chloroflexi bacterium CFX2]
MRLPPCLPGIIRRMPQQKRSSTPSKQHLSDAILAAIHKERILGIRAGTNSTHRVIGIWAVVVEGRVFVRSWSLKPRSWWRTFLEDPQGEIFVGDRKRGIKVRATQVKSEKMKEKVSAAYKEKYNKPGDIQYVKDMSRTKSRDTTTELTAV